MKILSILFLCLLGLTTSMQAVTVYWNTLLGDWNVAANWSTGTIPSAGDDVVITFGTANIPAGYTTQVQSVKVGLGGTLAIQNGADLAINGAIDQACLTNRGIVYINGQLTLLNAVPIIMINAPGISNLGIIECRSQGSVFIDDITHGSGMVIEEGGYYLNEGSFETGSSINGISILINHFGQMNNRGNILLNSGTGNAMWCLDNSGFINAGNLISHASSSIGIQISGNFINKINGLIEVRNATGLGLINNGTFTNKGIIDIDGPITGLRIAKGTFINKVQGEINISNIINQAIELVSCCSYKRFINEGSCILHPQNGMGIKTHGYFLNKPDGNIFIYGTVGPGISNTDSIINQGSITITGFTAAIQGNGIENEDMLINEAGGLISISHVDASAILNTKDWKNYGSISAYGTTLGLDNNSNGIFSNHESANVQFDADSDFSVFNSGTILNDCAIILNNKSIENNHLGQIDNYGKFYNQNNNAIHHINDGVFNNYGILADNNGILSNIINNEELIVLPIQGPLNVGTSVNNALQINNQDVTIVGDWKTTKTGTTLAGTYDPIINSFTPDSSAIGLDTIFVAISLDNCSTSTLFEVPILGGIQPLQHLPTELQINDEGILRSDDANIRISPNPSNGQFDIQFGQNAIRYIQLTDLQGKIIFQEEVDPGALQRTIHLEAKIAGGMYLLHLNDGEQSRIERVIIKN